MESSNGDDVWMEIGWNDDGLRILFPPAGWLICRHFRIDLWLTGVVLG
jgi:hypothetical protein